jgi:uncharacterized protein DUF3800
VESREHEGRWECALPLPTESGEIVAAFHIYVDESGKFKNPKDDYTAVCAYVAHISEWTLFSSYWENCRFRWQVPPIHLRKINRADEHPEWLKVKQRLGAAAASWEEVRDQMLDEFATIVAHSSIVCCGAVVDANYYRSLPPSKFKEGTQSSLFLAFHQVVMRAIEAVETVNSRSTIGLVLDNDEESAGPCFQQLNVLKATFAKVRERISSICFVNDNDYPGVQAADFLAYKAREFMVDRKQDPDCEPSILLKKLCGLNQLKLYTPTVLDALQAGKGTEWRDISPSSESSTPQ